MGNLNYYWTGGIDGNWRYNKKGEPIALAPITGTPPDASFSKISIDDIKDLLKLAKSSKDLLSKERLIHIFGKSEHALQSLVAKFGSEGKAFKAVENAANEALKAGKLTPNTKGILPSGDNGNLIDVEGLSVRLIEGKVEDNKVIISSFSRKGL